MGKVAKNNLGYLGIEFQYRLISAFFENPNFFKDMYPIIDQNMFTETYLKSVVGVMKEYYAKHETTASYEMLSIKLREKAYTEDDVQCYEEVIEKLKKTSTEGIDEIEELAEKFFKQQNWIRVSNEIRRIAGDGDVEKFDECQRLMEEAMAVGRRTEIAESPLDNIDDDLSKDNVVTIPTGVNSLDEVLGGGLDKGKIGLIIGASSFGKVLTYDTKVITPDGPTDLINIKVGDKVIGRDGMPHNVIGVFPHKDWEFYKVTFSDGVSCECGKEHLWTVIDSDGNEKTMCLGDIMETDFNSLRIPMADCATFNNEGIDSYVSHDKDFESFADNKKIPFIYLYSTPIIKAKLIKKLSDKYGFIDSDGRKYIRTDIYEFAKDIRTLYLSQGYSCTITENKGEYVIRYNKNGRYFKSIEPSRIADGACIKVDADDELFLINDFIVTHNTSMTTGFGAYEASYRCEANDNQGFKVLQIVFEDSNRDINRKYFSRMSQVETRLINESEEKTAYVRDMIVNHPDYELIKNNIRVMHLDTGEYSATGIRDVIKKKINEGFKPDVVIIDYFECLEPEKGTGNMAKWEQEAKTMRKLETFAKQLDVAIWLPTQGNRGSFSSDLVTMDQGSGSISKVQIAQVVISITRSMDDIKNQKATVAVLKNRSGGAGITLNDIKFDNGTCTIKSDYVVDFDKALGYDDDV